MFTSVASLDLVLQCLIPTFTQPPFQTHAEVLRGWVMCLGKRAEYGVFRTIRADRPIARKRRHPFDRFYNFFSRSAWPVGGLAQRVAVVIAAFSQRWSMEVAFESSPQVMQIQAPQHGCQESIEKLSPRVRLMQSVISLRYITAGRKLPQARAARRRFGKWDTEWSLGHMLRMLRAELLEDTIKPKSATKADLYPLLDHPEKYLNLAS